MFLIGTAGHVDHGKSVLVHSLTGIDPDRLPEEKDRGMTVDLGFAWLKLPSGREISIVDVPGHERFVKNMLAGVGSIDLAMLIIAADEGVMPQTREHLAILDLLRITSGIVVITKKDLVDDEWLELVALDASEVIQDTTIADAPIVPVSAITRDGLDVLLSTIDRLLDNTTKKKDVGRPRLPIDRVFTVMGFGTVVTGTLIDGSLSVGQDLEVIPSGLKTRIRGLQTHKRKIETATPGSRVAVNLTGIEANDLRRGDIIARPGWLKPTLAMDIKLRLVNNLPRPLIHNTNITFHTGSSEVLGKIRLLEKDKLEAGQTGWAQVLLVNPIGAVKGDLFVIRSSQDTLGGGEIIAVKAKRHRRFLPSVTNSLSAMEKGTPQEALMAALEEKQPDELATLTTRCNLSQRDAEIALQELLDEKKVVTLGRKGQRALVMTMHRLESQAQTIVKSHHKQFPMRRGIPKEELKNKLNISPDRFPAILNMLFEINSLVDEETAVRMPSHQIRLTKEQQATISTFLKSLHDNPYAPPGDSLPSPDLLNLLVEQNEVTKVSDNVIFSTPVYNEMVDRITDHIRTNGQITVGEVKDLFKTTRKYAVAIMEHLDANKITRRVGDERLLVQ